MESRLAVVISLWLLLAPLASASPGEGEEAPNFRLQDQHGAWHELSDYRGRWLALYFYPKADSPECTTEACAFRDDIFKFKALNVAVLGVSIDKVATQKAFSDKNQLPFPLLSDAASDTARNYGVLSEYGPIRMAVRETFLISPDGTVRRHYDRVDPQTHPSEVLVDVRRLIYRSKNNTDG